MFSYWYVCLSVCVQNISKRYVYFKKFSKQILMKCVGEVGQGPRNSQLDFGDDPDPILP